MAPDTKAKDPLLGRRLGDYVVERKLGEGAMGAVYRATDVNLRRQVALKVLREKLSQDVDYVERLKREARAVARLSHPNIVHIWSWGTDAGFTYFALEFVHGGSVASLLQRAGGKLPVRRACEIARDAARGLAAAHVLGLVHRDVKPDNMLLEVPPKSGSGVIAEEGMAEDDAWLAANLGRVKLADFGLAHDKDGERKITETGFFIGTPRYASPEQCRGNEVDGRSDLYSLGVSLYELLTGTVPHSAPGAIALLNKIMLEPPRPLREANPQVPESVAGIVGRLLAKSREDRHRDAGELEKDLDRAIEKLEVVRFTLLPHPDASSDTIRFSSEAATLDERPGSSKTEVASPRGPAAPLAPVVAGGMAGLPAIPPGSESHVTVAAPPGAVSPEPPRGRTPAPASTRGPRLAARLAQIDRLAESGHPIAGLHAAAAATEEIVAAADPDSSAALYATLGKILAMLRDPGARFRAVPSLARTLETFQRADIGLAVLGGELADLFRERAGEAAGASERAVHPVAVVTLADLSVGLALPWKWDVLVGAYDDAVVQLDPDGRQQVLAAATVLMGLAAPAEQAGLRAWNESRQIVPVVSLSNVGSIRGTSVGLPTLLAMLAARFGVVPREGLAATGALDAATIPSISGHEGAHPDGEQQSAALAARFLDVRVRPVEGTALKVRAVLEQCPGVSVLVLPRANERQVLADEALLADVRAAGLRLVFVETVRDLLDADLLAPRLAGPPLRRAGSPVSSPAPALAVRRGSLDFGSTVVLAQVIAAGAVLLLLATLATFV